jgi:hypothetical protein
MNKQASTTQLSTLTITKPNHDSVDFPNWSTVLLKTCKDIQLICMDKLDKLEGIDVDAGKKKQMQTIRSWFL